MTFDGSAARTVVPSYCTVRVSVIVRVAPPEVAVTVKEYVFACVAEDPPPPQADIANNNINKSAQAGTIRIILLFPQKSETDPEF